MRFQAISFLSAPAIKGAAVLHMWLRMKLWFSSQVVIWRLLHGVSFAHSGTRDILILSQISISSLISHTPGKSNYYELHQDTSHAYPMHILCKSYVHPTDIPCTSITCTSHAHPTHIPFTWNLESQIVSWEHNFKQISREDWPALKRMLAPLQPTPWEHG